jgi:uncharacterized protein YjbI with pentapeptide repeats
LQIADCQIARLQISNCRSQIADLIGVRFQMGVQKQMTRIQRLTTRARPAEDSRAIERSFSRAIWTLCQSSRTRRSKSTNLQSGNLQSGNLQSGNLQSGNLKSAICNLKSHDFSEMRVRPGARLVESP